MPLLFLYQFQDYKPKNILEKEICSLISYFLDGILAEWMNGQGWHAWERFGAWFVALKYNCHLILGKTQISLQEFHHGATFPDHYKSFFQSTTIQMDANTPYVLVKLEEPFDCTGQKFLDSKNVPHDYKTPGVYQFKDNTQYFDFCTVFNIVGSHTILVDFDQRKAQSNKTYKPTAELADAVKDLRAKNSDPNFQILIGVVSKSSQVTLPTSSSQFYVIDSSCISKYYGESFAQLPFLKSLNQFE